MDEIQGVCTDFGEKLQIKRETFSEEKGNKFRQYKTKSLLSGNFFRQK